MAHFLFYYLSQRQSLYSCIKWQAPQMWSTQGWRTAISPLGTPLVDPLSSRIFKKHTQIIKIRADTINQKNKTIIKHTKYTGKIFYDSHNNILVKSADRNHLCQVGISWVALRNFICLKFLTDNEDNNNYYYYYFTVVRMK